MKKLSMSAALFLLLLVSVVLWQNVAFAGETEGLQYVLPDFKPIWASYSLQDIRIATANASDRLVSCDDWTAVDDRSITGQRILTFTAATPNLGSGHLRTRRELIPGVGYMFYQTYSAIDATGSCMAIEDPIALVPLGAGQSGRWLPLAQFTLYAEADDGGVGDPVSCQMKRWCCLVSSPTCATNPPCSLPRRGDDIDAGARDVYPFHWLDQFIPIDGIPSGNYWVEQFLNPAGVMIESDYDNNTMIFKIELNQEAGTVRVIQPPDPTPCP